MTATPMLRCSDSRSAPWFTSLPTLDEIHMTTRLQGEKTRFLPFNQGSNPGGIECGAGNPPHPSGYLTSYFWQEGPGA